MIAKIWTPEDPRGLEGSSTTTIKEIVNTNGDDEDEDDDNDNDVENINNQ